MKKLTAEWVKKAEADFLAGSKLQRSSEPLHDQVSFFCQQSAEKYLKAILEEQGVPIPRTHNLMSLLPLLVSHHPSLRSLRRGLDFLTRIAVETRDPGHSTTKRQATSALSWAGSVRIDCRRLP